MATGYTYPVKEGEVTEFAEFAMQCARAFGALIMMRDDAADAAVPDTFLPDNEYNERAVAQYDARLAEIDGWDFQQAEANRDQDHELAMQSHAEMQRVRSVELARYRAMLAKVEAWEPPTTEHVGLKNFMVEQLTDSIKFDGYEMPEPELVSVKAYVARERAQASRMAAIYHRSIAEEIERAASRTAWVQALRASLSEAVS